METIIEKAALLPKGAAGAVPQPVQMQDILLLGICVRTSNAKEANPETAKIGATLERFWGGGIPKMIPNRQNPGTFFAVYTDYESDHNGPYTYFLGEAVTVLPEQIPEGFESRVIPAQRYAKFTAGPGPMPDVVISQWQAIWQMQPADLGAPRAYIADFELYDHRAQNPAEAVLDIYIGLNKEGQK